MKNTLLTTIVTILMLALNSIVAAQGFEGNTLRLTVDTPNIGNTIAGPFDSVVGSHIEFGLSGSGNGYNVVPVDIDLTSNTINLDYSSGGSFASGTFNGYVFTDLNDTIPDIQGVSIDSTTTLGIDGNRVSFNQNQIFINVASLSYNSSSKIKLYVNFSSALSETSCTGSVLPNLDIYMPSLSYETSLGTQNIWAAFKYSGINPEGKYTWELEDYGVNK